MNETKDIESSPYGYDRCLRENCPRGAECLHRLVALQDTPAQKRFYVINPQCLPAEGEECTHFHSATKVQVAWGIRHLLDRVPHSQAPLIKAKLIATFGRARYYRFYREELGLFPQEQETVRRIFRHFHIEEEPAYGRFTDEYRWRED